MNLTFEQMPVAIQQLAADMAEIKSILVGRKQSERPIEQYLTRNEAAAMLHITLPTLHEHTKKGKLKGYRVGKRMLYKPEDINSLLTAVKTNHVTQ